MNHALTAFNSFPAVPSFGVYDVDSSEYSQEGGVCYKSPEHNNDGQSSRQAQHTFHDAATMHSMHSQTQLQEPIVVQHPEQQDVDKYWLSSSSVLGKRDRGS